MPTYDYVCDDCEHAFELFQQMTAPIKKKCPQCGKLKLRRLIGTGAGVLFKGGGFYQTDYRSDSYKKAADADKPKSAGSDDKKKAGGDGGNKSESSKSDSSKSDSTKSSSSDSSASTKSDASNSAKKSDTSKGEPKK